MSIRLEVKIAPFPIDALCGCGLERPPPHLLPQSSVEQNLDLAVIMI